MVFILVCLFTSICCYMYMSQKMKNLNYSNLEKIFSETDYYVDKTKEETGEDRVIPYFYMINPRKSSGVIMKYDYFKEHFSFLYDAYRKNNLIVKRLTHKGITNSYVLSFLTEKVVIYPYISVGEKSGEYKNKMDNVYPDIYFLESKDMNKICKELQINDTVCGA